MPCNFFVQNEVKQALEKLCSVLPSGFKDEVRYAVINIILLSVDMM